MLDRPVRALDHDRRLGQRGLVLPALLVNHPEADQAEVANLAVEGFLHQQLERRVGALILKAGVLELFDLAQNRFHRRVGIVHIEPELLGFVNHVAAARQVGDQNALVVTDQFGVNMFIGFAVFLDSGDVQPALVGEGAGANVGLTLVRLDIGQLVHGTGNRRQALELARADTPVAQLELEVGHDRAQIGVPAPLAKAVDRTLHLTGSGLHPGQRVGHRQLAVVVAVNAQPAVQSGGRPSRPADLVRHAAPARIAQNQHIGPGLGGSRQTRQGVVGAGLVAVKKMLGIEKDLVHASLEIGDRVANDIQVGLE